MSHCIYFYFLGNCLVFLGSLYIARACGIHALTNCGVGLVHCSLCIFVRGFVPCAQAWTLRRPEGDMGKALCQGCFHTEDGMATGTSRSILA